MPTLANAYVRLERADEHLQSIRQLAEEICVAQAEATRVEIPPGKIIAPGEFGHVLTVESANTPIPAKLGVLIGDCINSLRSCLDYLTTELAELDSGEAKQRNQFPVEKSPTDFMSKRKTFLRGVSDRNVEKIESLQPYNGADWTRNLARLSNWDKHNRLLVVAHDYLVGATISPNEAFSAADAPLKITMHIQPSLRIQFEDGLQLLEALTEVRIGTQSTLEYFAPQFSAE